MIRILCDRLSRYFPGAAQAAAQADNANARAANAGANSFHELAKGQTNDKVDLCAEHSNNGIDH